MVGKETGRREERGESVCRCRGYGPRPGCISLLPFPHHALQSPHYAPRSAVALLFGGADASPAIARGRAMAEGALLCRYLVEAPPNVCTPR